MGNLTIGAFAGFLRDYKTKDETLVKNCFQESVGSDNEEKKAKYRKCYVELVNESFSIQAGTGVRDYRQEVINLGIAHRNYLDKEYGNGDGKLTTDEFIKSENDLKFECDSTVPEKLAKRINLNGDDEIDEKEMAALLMMYDVDAETAECDGNLKYQDIIVTHKYLDADNIGKWGEFFNKRLQMIYETLFPSKN